MRHVVYLLLIANLVYFGWNLYRDGTVQEVVRELPPLPATAKPLVTLEELQQQSTGTAKQGEQTSIDTLTMSQPPGAGVPGACRAFGPFFTEAELHAVAGRVDGLGLQSRQRIAKVRKANGYWIYLPSMNRARAREIARQLDEHDDHEYYIGKDNFMSLGTFKDISRAEVRLRQLQEMGLDPILEARYITQDAYWLVFKGGSATASALDALTAANPDLQLHTLACL